MNIEEWADKTVEIYNSIAKEYGISYYNQSPLNNESHPKILVVGDNPGSDGKYREMTGNDLLAGNPTWGERSTWKFTQNLYRKLVNLNIEKLDNGKDCLFTNATFFGTKSLSHKHLAELMKMTIPCTIALIKILQPKMIITFSGAKILNMLKRALGETDSLEYAHCIASLYYGKLNDIPIYGIPHTSASKTFEEWDLTTKAILYLQEHKEVEFNQKDFDSELKNEIKLYEWRIKSKQISFNLHKAENILKSTLKNIIIKHEKNTIRISNWIEKNNLEVTITTEAPQYVGIRHQSYREIYTKGNYPQETYWRGKLEKNPFNYINKYFLYWLGQKGLAEYGNTTEDIIKNIITEIETLSI